MPTLRSGSLPIPILAIVGDMVLLAAIGDPMVLLAIGKGHPPLALDTGIVVAGDPVSPWHLGCVGGVVGPGLVTGSGPTADLQTGSSQ